MPALQSLRRIVKRPAKNALARMQLLGAATRLMWALEERDPKVRRDIARLRREGAPDGLPLPPLGLIELVDWSPDAVWFLESGQRAAESIARCLERSGFDIDEMEAILDFGCGCGRVIRHWRRLDSRQVFGTDYNPEMIAWCREHLDFAKFGVNGLSPPLEYPDDSFDLVYALSVFTHLPEQIQKSWMAELARVVKPGGHLIITTQGTACFDLLTRREREEFLGGRVVVKGESFAGGGLCLAFHPMAYVRDVLAKNLEVVTFTAQGATGNPPQDMYLLRTPA